MRSLGILLCLLLGLYLLGVVAGVAAVYAYYLTPFELWPIVPVGLVLIAGAVVGAIFTLGVGWLLGWLDSRGREKVPA